MKLCLNARQDYEYLQYANEILFNWEDKNAILNIANKYPEHTIILDCPLLEIDWNIIENFQNQLGDRFILRILYIVNAIECQKKHIQYYLKYAICSYDELKAVIGIGVYYVRLGAPLFFDLDNIKKYYPNLKIRIVPNQAYADAYPRTNGIVGTWIRPEDIRQYNEYVEVLEFEESDVKREQALYRIYWVDRKWSGELNLIIPDIGHPAVNRVVLSDITEKRLNCGQKCQANNICKICYRALDLANPDLLEEYQDAVTPKYKTLNNSN